jgi:hypothetical protein
MSVHGIIEALLEIAADSFSSLGPASPQKAESRQLRNDLFWACLLLVALSAAITLAFVYLI